MEGGSNVDGDESGGTSPSRQGAGTGILSPRNLVVMAAEIGIASGEKGSGIRVSSMGVKIGAKGGTRGGPSCPGALWARPTPRPHREGTWVTCVPLRLSFGDSGRFLHADFLYIFPGIYWAL